MLSERPHLHFGHKSNSDNDMFASDGVLEGIDTHMVYKKKQGDHLLYSYKDIIKTDKEDVAHLFNTK